MSKLNVCNNRFFLLLLLLINITLLLYIVYTAKHGNYQNTEQCDTCFCSYVYKNQYSCQEEPGLSSTIETVRRSMITLSPKLDPAAAEVMSYSIVTSSAKYNVNPLYAAFVAFVESGFNPTAVSSVGAHGMFQVMKFNKVNKDHIDFGINSDSGLMVLKRCLNASSNNCIEAYLCYVYGENGYKIKVDSKDVPPTVGKLSTLLMINKIYNCGNFVYY